MIHALDHIVVAAASLEAAVADYEVVLDRRADRPDAGRGAPRASIQLANVRLELASAGAGDGLSALAFAVADLGKAEQLLERRALPPSRSDDGHVLRIASEVTHRVPLLLVERAPEAISPSQASGEEDATVTGLDHIVIRSPNPERAVALYAGRLGLSLRLDRSEPAWGMRLLFFRCGDLVVEVAHDLKAGIGDGPDRLWGLSWRVPDIAKAHARMRAAGIGVSDLRVGRRPHTRVFTAKSHTAGVPTLVIGADPRQVVLPSHPLSQA
jgi:catechol 2,3-dioxygenase-like lactoylglutathione lyase family enzyme